MVRRSSSKGTAPIPGGRPKPQPNKAMRSSLAVVFPGSAFLRWAMSILLAAWAIRELRRPVPRAVVHSSGLPMAATAVSPALSSRPIQPEPGSVPGPAPRGSTSHANDRVDVSPRLQGEILALRHALRDSLSGQEPLEAAHALLTANWVINMMLDAAYQDALELGREANPGLARTQVMQVLEENP